MTRQTIALICFVAAIVAVGGAPIAYRVCTRLIPRRRRGRHDVWE